MDPQAEAFLANSPSDGGESPPSSEQLHQQQQRSAPMFSVSQQAQQQQQQAASSSKASTSPPQHNSVPSTSGGHDSLGPLPSARHTGRPRQSDGAALLAAPKHPISSNFQDNNLSASTGSASMHAAAAQHRESGSFGCGPPSPSSTCTGTAGHQMLKGPVQFLNKLKLGGKKGSMAAMMGLSNNPPSGSSTPRGQTAESPSVLLSGSAFETHPHTAAAAVEGGVSSSAAGAQLRSSSKSVTAAQSKPLRHKRNPSSSGASLSVEVPPPPAALLGQTAQPLHSSATYHPSPGGAPSSSGQSALNTAGSRSMKQPVNKSRSSHHAVSGGQSPDEMVYHHSFMTMGAHAPTGNRAVSGHSEGDVEEFSPGASQPHNPLAPLLTPFRMMAPVASKAIAAAKADMKKNWKHTTSHTFPASGAAAEAADESSPPMGYMWLWLGSFKRWQRRFFVASEAPGLLLIYKRSSLKGKVWSISLRNAVLEKDDSNPRQLKISAPQGEIFLRTIKSADRDGWLKCLQNSIEVYKQNQLVVEVLKNKGLLSQEQDTSNPTSGCGIKSMLPLPEVADMDVEQRRRIRCLLAERLAQVAPFQAEMERHMVELSAKLREAVPGLTAEQTRQPSRPGMTAGKMASSPPGLQLDVDTVPAPPPGHPHRDSAPQQQHQTQAGGGAAKRSQRASLLMELRESDGTPSSAAATAQTAANDLSLAPLAAAAAGVAPPASTGTDSANSGRDSDPGKTAAKNAGVAEWAAAQACLANVRQADAAPKHCQNIQQAYSQLLEAVRRGFHAEAVRTVQLEMENFALGRTVTYMKQQHSSRSRALDRARSSNNGRFEAREIAAATASLGTPSACLQHRVSHSSPFNKSPSMHSNYDDGASVMTADEDAFDVTEAFDDGVDYGILDDDEDEDEDMEEQSDREDGAIGRSSGRGGELHAVHSVEANTVPMPRVGADERTRRNVKRRTTRITTGPSEDEDEDDEGHPVGQHRIGHSEEEDAEEAEQAKVLNALEVVRQVEYVEKVQNAEGLTDVITTHAPPTANEQSVTAGPQNEQGGGEADEEENEESDNEEDNAHEYKGVRTRLPMPRPLGKGFSLWSLMKNMIGKDLTKITMPATINEPTSSLQRLAELHEYSNLLDRLPDEPNSIDRLLWVTVWNLSCYNSLQNRDGKPFNPLLGETYEWQSPDRTRRYVSEQVSHHPPVLAYMADDLAHGWDVQGELETKSKFWGKSVEVFMWGAEALRTKPWGDEFRWNRATICVSDVILGNHWIQIYGKVKVHNAKTGEYAILNFKPCRGRKQDRGICDALVYNAQGEEVWKIEGNVHENLVAQLTPKAAAARGMSSPPQPEVVWTKEPYPEDAAMQYWFTKFAITLNDPADPIVAHVPPTDTRFRQDQRALELGEFNRSTTEKLRLEEKQRQVRRERAAKGIKYEPLWFKQNDPNSLVHLPHESGLAWRFNPEYWQRTQTRDWSMCPDLYSVDGVPVPEVPQVNV